MGGVEKTESDFFIFLVSAMNQNLDKMRVLAGELNEAMLKFVELKSKYAYQGVKNSDIYDRWKKAVKAGTTFENRLNKSRLELEILNKEFKELVDEYDARGKEAMRQAQLEREQEEKEYEERMEALHKDQQSQFQRFVDTFVVRTGADYDADGDETLTNLWRAYCRWQTRPGKVMPHLDFQQQCDKAFEKVKNPDGLTRYNVLLFDTKEEKDEFLGIVDQF